RADRFAPFELDREIALLAGDRRHFGIQDDLDPTVGNLTIPGLEDRFTLAGVEVEIAPQHQIAGRRHDVLALLVLEYRIREVVRLLDQHMAHAALCRARGSREPRRPRADDSHVHALT